MMKTKVICDGSTVEWEPEYDEPEGCPCCGASVEVAEEDRFDYAKPDFHAFKGGACTRCGEPAPAYLSALQITMERFGPALAESIERDSAFLAALKYRKG